MNMDFLLDRIRHPYPKQIECGEGWHPLLTELHNELTQIDPNYRIYQIKQKFEGLRFYAQAANPDNEKQLQETIYKYEEKSFHIDEHTGQPK